MANIVSLIMQYLTPDMIGRIASALGLDRTTTQTSIGASVPALLAALGSAATQPGGAQRLADAASQQTGALDNIASMIGGHSGYADSGAQMLSSLLGGGQQNMLTSAISKFAGVGQATGGSLLGMLAPLVMGVIGRQLGSGGITSSSIANLLASQKDNIAAALPAGLRDQLRGTGLIDSLQGATSTASAAASQAYSAGRTAVDSGTRAARTATATAMSYNWLYWALPAIAIVALLYYMLGRPGEQVATQVPPAASSSMVVGGLDVNKHVNDTLATLRSSLQDIRDPVSAAATQSTLQQVTERLDKVVGMTGQMSADQRKMLSGYISPSMTSLNQMFETVLAIPGVAPVVKPHIDAIKTKLTTLTITA
jgi:Bacterial protein of unknown function (DUF937)